MEKIKCNACGASEVEPKIVVQERADLSFGEVPLCPECESEDIVADEGGSDCARACDYTAGSNQPCATCPRLISTLYRCGLLQEAARDSETNASVEARP